MFNTTQFNSTQFNAKATTTGYTILAISKTITLNVTFSGLLVGITKTISANQSNSCILSIAKRIAIPNPASLTFYQRFGWEPIVILNGAEVSYLTGVITVTKTANDNHTAAFSVVLTPATYHMYQYQGAPVQIYYYKAGVLYLVFTGVVDIPTINVLEEKLTLNCIADRRVLLGKLATLLPYIGYYSPTVQGTYNGVDIPAQFNNQLSTIPYDLDFDSNNQYSLNAWSPKTSADFIYGSSAIYRRTPMYTVQSTSKVINQITITMQYNYQRLHHREMVYTWDHPYAPSNPETGEGGICPFLEDAPSMPTRTAIHSSATATGWAVKEDTFFYGKQFKQGSYQCSGVWVQWSTVQTGYVNATVYDANDHPVLDSNGNAETRSVQTTVADNTNVYTMNAAWDASKRFNQNVTEYYTAVVEAPSSIAQYGLLTSTSTYNYTDPDQHPEWAQYTTWAPPPAGSNPQYDDLGSSYIIDASDNRAIFNSVFITAINKAKTQILAANRDTRIVFQKPLEPTLELKHTCQLTGKWVNGAGKCNVITHTMNITKDGGGKAGEAYTEVTLLAYRATYNVSETLLVPLNPPINDYVPIQPGIGLESHIGVDPSAPGSGSANWTGYVGNKVIVQHTLAYDGFSGEVSGVPGTNITRSAYPESFIVNSPAITDLTQNIVFYGAGTYNINIPTDNTNYTAYRGKGSY